MIGVFEYQPLAAELKTMGSSLKVDNRKIEVRELTSVEEMGDCNIVFVTAYKARSIPEVLKKLKRSDLTCNE